eukprot:TRINITY_DN12616_c0_g2_i2.p1 TRINITY_DN12616_c0_g2~~TRINITY_DN12616_c0_g2_i2.p1  ORF type:complete len:155 (+),score=24.88 TRINITY_DN12616_c0_g2_i2:88-552(+)
MQKGTILMFIFVFCVGSIPDCTHIDDLQHGFYYDLSPIIGKELKITEFSTDYTASICTNSFECGRGCVNGAGYCLSNQYYEDCVGAFDLALPLRDPEIGVELVYGGGDWGYVGRIKLLCDPSAGDEAASVKKLGNDAKSMVAPSKHACPKTSIH